MIVLGSSGVSLAILAMVRLDGDSTAGGSWVPRLLLTIVVAIAVAAVLILMRWGWVRRARRQASLAPLLVSPAVPPATSAFDLTEVEARYLGASRSGQWLDRVVVHRLGVVGSARVSVRQPAEGQPSSSASRPAGVWIHRPGQLTLFLPAHSIAAARHDRAVAARAVEQGGLVVIEWLHDGVAIDLGLRIRAAESAEALRAAIERLSRSAQTEPGAPSVTATTSSGDPA